MGELGSEDVADRSAEPEVSVNVSHVDAYSHYRPYDLAPAILSMRNPDRTVEEPIDENVSRPISGGVHSPERRPSFLLAEGRQGQRDGFYTTLTKFTHAIRD